MKAMEEAMRDCRTSSSRRGAPDQKPVEILPACRRLSLAAERQANTPLPWVNLEIVSSCEGARERRRCLVVRHLQHLPTAAGVVDGTHGSSTRMLSASSAIPNENPGAPNSESWGIRSAVSPAEAGIRLRLPVPRLGDQADRRTAAASSCGQVTWQDVRPQRRAAESCSWVISPTVRPIMR